WEELPKVEPGSFSLQTAPARLAASGDLFAPLLSLRQELPLEYLI
ncbi:MAG TPA: ATP-dependent DNA ligase, partial [Firmicutes bacterium]|nr:ATP-dependent DNA ligase [Bacillota bacterium]